MTDTVKANFKSSLPPRKRAKTQEEKEQRRVERILRNRRAAHASREKKRKHVEYLESYVLALEKNNQALASNLEKLQDILPKDKLATVELDQLVDVSDLKGKIHENLTCNTTLTRPYTTSSRQGFDYLAEGDAEVKYEETDTETNFSVVPESSPILKQVKVEADSNEADLSLNSTGGYFNYMSPVSINSSVNSPLDLRLKKSETESPSRDSSLVSSPFSNSTPNTPEMSGLDVENVMHGAAIPGVDIMAQSSEVTLYPRLLILQASLHGDIIAPVLLIVLCLFRPIYSLTSPRKTCINLVYPCLLVRYMRLIHVVFSTK